MTHPQNKLLLWAGLLILPCAALAGLFPERLWLLGAPVAVFALVLVWDAARGAKSVRSIGLAFPEVTRLVRGKPGVIEMTARHPARSKLFFRLGLALPPGLAGHSLEQWVELPAGSPTAKVSWPCSAWQRGRFSLGACRVATKSPWGFWELRRGIPTRGQIRVYPDLLSNRRAAAAVFLQRGNPGLRQFRQVGQGREFEKLREYLPGDGYDEIHWKATAKRNRPVTKIFQIERTQEVYVLVDASRLSGRRIPARAPAHGGSGGPPAPDEFMLERFVNAALLFALAAQGQGDLFGLLPFDDKLGTFVRAGRGLAHFGACREAIHGLMPKAVSPDFGEVFSFIGARLRKRSLLVFLTSLEDPVGAESFLRHVKLACRRHLIMVLAPKPPEALPLFDRKGRPEGVDDLYSLLGGHFCWAEMRETGGKLERLGVRFHAVENEGLSVEIISRYLELKRRQLL
jgi:uncharacterized protein (DUF58 family)